MTKLPEPRSVEELRRIEPATFELAAGSTLARIFPASGPHPSGWSDFRRFGPTAARFDHHLSDLDGASGASLQARGILYAATGARAFPTCLAEVFQDVRVIDRRRFDRALAYFATSEPLVLLDLRGAFATRMGASMAIHSGPRPRARRWARNLYEAYPHVHGIRYASSMHAGEPAVALFERAAHALPARPEMVRPLSDPHLERAVRETARAIGYEWL